MVFCCKTYKNPHLRAFRFNAKRIYPNFSNLHSAEIFARGVLAAGWYAPCFLKLLCVGCRYVCVSVLV